MSPEISTHPNVVGHFRGLRDPAHLPGGLPETWRWEEAYEHSGHRRALAGPWPVLVCTLSHRACFSGVARGLARAPSGPQAAAEPAPREAQHVSGQAATAHRVQLGKQTRETAAALQAFPQSNGERELPCGLCVRSVSLPPATLTCCFLTFLQWPLFLAP